MRDRWIIKSDSMPTYIQRTRRTSDDLKAISAFVLEEQKNWEILRPQLRNLRTMFNNYLQAVENPSKHKAWRKYNKSAATAFHFLYESKAKCLSYVDNFRHEAIEKLGGCPYCGLPSNITLDHYLPRKVGAFPEFSILSKNLVPACSDCQGKKSDFYVLHKEKLSLKRGARHKSTRQLKKTSKHTIRKTSKKSHRALITHAKPLRLIHPYLDSFLMHSVLSVYPTDQFNTFAVHAKGSLRKEDRERLNFHLRKLKIGARCNGAIGRYRNGIIRDLSSNNISFDRESVMKELPRLLKSALERTALAPNAIEPAYIKSLINHPSTLDDLINCSQQRIEPNILAAKPIIL